MSIIKKSIQGLGFNALKVICTFFVNILVANIFSDPVPFGLILYAMSIVDFTSVFLSLGMNGAVVRYTVDHHKDGSLQEFIQNLVSLVLGAQLLWFLLLLIWPEFWSNLFFQSNQIELIYFIAFYTSLRVFRQLIFSVHWGMNDFVSRGFTDILPTFLNLLILFISYVFVSPIQDKVLLIIISFILSEVISLLILNEHFKKIFKYRFLNRIFFYRMNFRVTPILRKNLRFGFYTLIGALTLTSMTLVDRYTINQVLSQDILGKYITVVGLASYLIVLVTVVSNVLMSNFIQGWQTNSARVINSMKDVHNKINLIVLIFGLILFAGLEKLISFLYGTIYSGLEYILPYLMIGILLQIFFIIYGNLSALSDNPQITTYALIPGLIIKVVGNHFFTEKYGITALVGINILSFLVISISLIGLLKHYGIVIGIKPILTTILYCIPFYFLKFV
jgi:O-antigen/teichoic acid export membrane protein